MRDISALILFSYVARTWQAEEAAAATTITFQPGPTGMDVWPKREQGPMYVFNVTKGSQAEKAGVQKGWTIVKIGEKPCSSRSLFKPCNSSYDVSFYQVNATAEARVAARRYEAAAYLRDYDFLKTTRQRREEAFIPNATKVKYEMEKKAAAKAAIAKFRTARKDSRREQFEIAQQERDARKVNFTKVNRTYTRGEINAFRAEVTARANMTKLEKLLDALTIRAAGDVRSYNARTSQHGPSFAAKGAFRNQINKDSLHPYIQHLLMQRALQISRPLNTDSYGSVKIQGVRLVDHVNPYFPNGNTVDSTTAGKSGLPS